MAYTTQQFLDKMKPYCIKDMKQSGVLASLTAAQGLIESNKGNSGLTQKANNLFGIKGKYNGQSVNMMTTEYYNGIKTRVPQDFRKYPSWQESVNDHSDLFRRLSRYSNLINCQDYEEACVNVKKDGYATSPTYAQTLINTIRGQKLWLWDYEVLKLYSFNRLRTIQQGADGGGVYLLQKLLNENGYQISCDGQFGGQTDNALRKYQFENGLVTDGICGQRTWSKIRV